MSKEGKVDDETQFWDALYWITDTHTLTVAVYPSAELC